MISKLDFLLGTVFGRAYLYFGKKNKVRFAKHVINSFYGDELSQKDYKRMMHKMRSAYILDGWGPDEYINFGYEKLNKASRDTYLLECNKEIMVRNLNSEKVITDFDNKWITFQIFKDYFSRDVCMISRRNPDYCTFNSFLKTHDRFIVKPVDGSMGDGVRIVDSANAEVVRNFVEQSVNGVIVEELIEQASELANFHPQSVNTIRLTTFVKDGKVNFLQPFLRIGRHDSIVDNGAKGGLLCFIDPDTGVLGAARDEFGNSFEFHPETKVPIKGEKIPQFELAKQMAKELAQVRKDCRYAGWDLAYTVQGWVLVEANSKAQLVGQQLLLNRGIKPDLLSLAPHCLDVRFFRTKNK